MISDRFQTVCLASAFKRFCVIALCAMAAVSCEKDDPADVPDTPEPETYDAPYFLYGAAHIDIETDGGAEVDSKEVEDYRDCSIEITGSLEDSDGKQYDMGYSGRGKVRGRGNSTWYWYNKKPYRIKLDHEAALMGMEKDRDWVLLADYRDVTHMMNFTGFTMAHSLGLPYTNHARYATVTLNGEDMGLYMVTEQVEAGDARVNVCGEGGLLLALDVNDGPGDCPDATDNFYSKIYYTDVCVKYPEEPTPDELKYAKSEFATLEKAIESRDWSKICSLLDVESVMKYLMIQEAICNVEMNNGNSIRSGYIHREPGGLWTMGPLWDCDGGFSYSWGDMYDSRGMGHTYFDSYRTLIFGTDPSTQRGAYGGFPDYFSDLFSIPEFTERYQVIWKQNSASLLETLIDGIDQTYTAIGTEMKADASKWGISRNYDSATEVGKLKEWLQKRFAYLDKIVAAYPVDGGSESGEVQVVKTVSVSISYAQDGHHYGTALEPDSKLRTAIEETLGIEMADITGLYYSGDLTIAAVTPDGQLDWNCTASDANGIGFWYDSNSGVTSYGTDSQVFVEFNFDTLSFTLGKHPTLTQVGNYKVKYAFAYLGKAIAIEFDIEITSE